MDYADLEALPDLVRYVLGDEDLDAMEDGGGSSSSRSSSTNGSDHFTTSAAAAATADLPMDLDLIQSVLEDEGGSRVCPVCLELFPGRGHVYYGAEVCSSCRVFFRRSVKGNKFADFACKEGSDQCAVDSKSGKSCRRCRFRRCLESGMRISYVTGAGADKRDEMALVRKDPAVRPVFTRDEESFCLRMADDLEDKMHAMYYDNIDPDSLAEFYDHLFTGKRPMSRDLCRYFDSTDEKVIKNILFSLEDMSGLTPYDRMTLVAANYGTVLGILWTIYASEQDAADYFKNFYEYGLRRRRHSKSVSAILDKLEQRSYWDRPPRMSCADWLEKAEDVEFSREVSDKMVRWSRDDPRDRYDRVQMVLAIMMVLFEATGDMDMQNRGAIDSLRDRYLWLLYRYLRTRYGDAAAAKRLHQGLMLTEDWKTVLRLFRKQISRI